MKKALLITDLNEKFTEHDLRAKVASDSTLTYAHQLLGHSSPEITARIYRRKPELVKPSSDKKF